MTVTETNLFGGEHYCNNSQSQKSQEIWQVALCFRLPYREQSAAAYTNVFGRSKCSTGVVDTPCAVQGKKSTAGNGIDFFIVLYP